MSFDVELVNRKTREVVKLNHPRKLHSGNVPACMEDGFLVPIGSEEASITITSNYSRYYWEATQDDIRFAHPSIVNDEEVVYGFRGLNEKTAAESIPMLTDMIQRIVEKYTDNDRNWLVTHRSKVIYVDALGRETSFSRRDHKESKEYDISEGNTGSYWEATAANAIRPLRDMLQMAIDNLLEDVVWEIT